MQEKWANSLPALMRNYDRNQLTANGFSQFYFNVEKRNAIAQPQRQTRAPPPLRGIKNGNEIERTKSSGSSAAEQNEAKQFDDIHSAESIRA